MAEQKRNSTRGWGRGRGSGRGSGRGGWGRSSTSRGEATIEPTAPAVGSLLATISRDELDDSFPTATSNKELAKITDCKLVGSYNWLNRKCPTILVPGSPPAWTPAPAANKLPPDSGSYFRDQNAARYAVHVFQPALEAILKQDSEFDFNKIDLVACGSTLGNLRRFVSEPDKEFRFVVEAVGSAVFLVRRENSPTQTIPNVFGYGHTFPEANTTWAPDIKGSESHQRLLQYQFGGLSCLVRYEGDGYLPKLHQPRASEGKATVTTPDDLLPSFKQAVVGLVESDANEALAIKTGGEIVPQSAIFDLKTRTYKKEYKDVLNAELPRLWQAQVSNFVVGFHKYGVFDDVRVEDVRNRVLEWEEEQGSNLRKLAALLRMLVAFAQGQADGRFEVVYTGDELELREVGGVVNSCIPDLLKRRWMEGGIDEREAECDEGAKDGWRNENGRWKEWEEEGEPGGWQSDSESEKDFTACSASSCGYCGHCGH